MLSLHFVIYTAVMCIFPVGVFTLLVCQVLAEFSNHKIKDKVQRILLYSVYISALACACFGYSLHVSRNHPRWCDVFGLPPCFAFLGGSKAFLYAFFLRRARHANAFNIEGNDTALFLFDYIGPIYILIYWLCYVAFAAVLFTGRVATQQDEDIISYCLFESWRWWFVIFSNTVDVFNCFATLALFIVPLLQSVKRLRSNNDNVNPRLTNKFIHTMRWNVVLSFIATISSVSALISIPVVKEYIWLFCSGDPFINALCVYFMMATNRTFAKNHCCGICNRYGSRSEVVMNQMIAHDTRRPRARTMSTVQSRSPQTSPQSKTNEDKNTKEVVLIAVAGTKEVETDGIVVVIADTAVEDTVSVAEERIEAEVVQKFQIR